jgi:hypothetical protein
MRAIMSGQLNIILILIIPLLLLCGFILRRVVFDIRGELSLAKYKMERGPIEEAPKPPPADVALPGYVWLTKEDYDELLSEIVAEQRADSSESGAVR